MACNCSDNSLGNTQNNLVAYVMPGGCGPRSEQLYAMSDSGDWSGIRITNVTNNRRGTRTPILRRSGRNPRQSKRCGVQEAAPAANSITVEVEACGCGGLDYSELIDCELDVLEYEVCCDDAGDPENNFAKIKHWRGISIENDQYSNRVSFDSNDTNTLTITHAGEFSGAHTYYKMEFNEIAASVGMPTGTIVTDLVYSEKENCGTSGCGRKIGCGEQWYAITDDGNVIYKSGPGDAVASVAIPGWVPSDLDQYTNITIFRNRLYVTQSVGSDITIYIADINKSSGEPGAFTATVNTAIDARPYDFLTVRNELWLYGDNMAIPLQAGVVFAVASNGSLTNIYTDGTANTSLVNADSCENSVVFSGIDGTVLVNSGCGDQLAAIPAPPGAPALRAAGLRTGNEIWVGADDGSMYWTETNGEIWNEVTLPTVGPVIDMKWATPCVGFVLNFVGGEALLYTTWNGGLDWTASTDRIDSVPTGLDANTRIRIPCCTNGTAQVNNVSIVGGDGATGGIFQSVIANC